MKTIYLALIEKLKTIHELNWIDMDSGQLSSTERAPIALPAALLEISLPECRNFADLTQFCVARINVKLIFEKKTIKTSANTPTETLNKSLETYDIISKVYATLQGFETDDFSALHRTSQGPEINVSYFVYRMSFDCEFEDLSAEK